MKAHPPTDSLPPEAPVHFSSVPTATGRARLGHLTTRHGVIDTPQFMPVGTQATVKALTPGDLRDAGARMILANTYHLSLRPTAERIARLGGLHRFMAWDGPILTDSGGFQVFSLAHLRRVDDDGVTFASHLDGSDAAPHPGARDGDPGGCSAATSRWPSTSWSIRTLPSDEVARAMERTHRWAERCLAARERADQALFGIIQGGVDADLRAHVDAGHRRRCRSTVSRSAASRWGESQDEMCATLEVVAAAAR